MRDVTGRLARFLPANFRPLCVQDSHHVDLKRRRYLLRQGSFGRWNLRRHLQDSRSPHREGEAAVAGKNLGKYIVIARFLAGFWTARRC